MAPIERGDQRESHSGASARIEHALHSVFDKPRPSGPGEPEPLGLDGFHHEDFSTSSTHA